MADSKFYFDHATVDRWARAYAGIFFGGGAPSNSTGGTKVEIKICNIYSAAGENFGAKLHSRQRFS